ncbi:Dolichyl-phosphate [Nesidiocoris tenuis]|uniref:dolichyl-phosphate beta-glucosyltransferase n=1 Tax=Nesidiocoris tenuis TaxID=355587 RepID=A0ABN7BE78_9HEMI|nr:Dolichyl-phosphate [Nesidiocoris tenuis]
MDFGVFATFTLALVAIAILGLFLCVMFFNASTYPIIRKSDEEKRFYDPNSGVFEDFPNISDEHSVDLSVVVPAYNEEQRLPPMLDEALEYLEDRQKKSGFSFEIIIVSDGSTDRTVAVAHEYSRKHSAGKVRVLDLAPNRGKGGAVRLGVLSSRGAVILFADADGATKFADLGKLEAALQNIVKDDYTKHPANVASAHAVVVGSRAHLEEESLATRSWFRNLLMLGFHFIVRAFAVRTIRDTQCGFKLFTRSAARSLFSSIHVERWAFDVELLYIAEKLFPGCLDEIPVNWTEIDGSKIVPVLSWVQMGRDVFLIWIKYLIGAWKIRAALHED